MTPPTHHRDYPVPIAASIHQVCHCEESPKGADVAISIKTCRYNVMNRTVFRRKRRNLNEIATSLRSSQ